MFLNNATSGLNNLGNSCFFNSILQLLYQCSVLNKFIISNNINGSIIDIYTNFINSYSNSIVFSPILIIGYVSKKLNRNGYIQEDADEYFTFMLDKILDEINKWIINKCINNYILDNKNITVSQLIKNLFSIENKNKVICPLCYFESNTSEINNRMILSINNNASNLNDLLYNYYKKEILSDENKIECSNCNKKINATLTKTIFKLPKYLIIVLNRFNNNNTKNNNNIDMPLNFKLSYKNYLLRGIVHHSGSTEGGHYIYYGKKDTWKLYNDSTINCVNDENINNIKNFGYIYLYVDK